MTDFHVQVVKKVARISFVVRGTFNKRAGNQIQIRPSGRKIKRGFSFYNWAFQVQFRRNEADRKVAV